MELIELAKRVRRGVRLLDRRIPNWRKVLQKYRDQFDFTDGAHCVLGTLEHHSGRMQTLKRRKQTSLPGYAYNDALVALGLAEGTTQDEDHGFDAVTGDEERYQLEALWRAEFEPLETT